MKASRDTVRQAELLVIAGATSPPAKVTTPASTTPHATLALDREGATIELALGFAGAGHRRERNRMEKATEMSERSWEPLAIAIVGLSLAVLSYAIKDWRWGAVAYGCGLASAALSLLHWFASSVHRPVRR